MVAGLGTAEPVGSAVLVLALTVWIPGVIATIITVAVASLVLRGSASGTPFPKHPMLVMGYLVTLPLPALLAAAGSAWFARRSVRGGFERAFPIVCFTSGGLVLGAVPILGGLIGALVWTQCALRGVLSASPSKRAPAATMIGLLFLLMQGLSMVIGSMLWIFGFVR